MAPRPNRFPATLLGAGIAMLACLPPTALGWAAAVPERPGAGPADAAAGGLVRPRSEMDPRRQAAGGPHPQSGAAYHRCPAHRAARGQRPAAAGGRQQCAAGAPQPAAAPQPVCRRARAARRRREFVRRAAPVRPTSLGSHRSAPQPVCRRAGPAGRGRDLVHELNLDRWAARVWAALGPDWATSQPVCRRARAAER